LARCAAVKFSSVKFLNDLRRELTIYLVKEDLAAFLIQHKLRKDPPGDMEFFHRFWRPDAVPPNRDAVDPLLGNGDVVSE
jgi:hypothetical protein